jgi:predicted AAA+ superfamily ATPase
MRLFKREDYLEKIRGFYHDDGIAKVITGVRRCGKSCLMQTIAREIQRSGVADDRIIYLDLDKYGFRSVKTPGQLEALIEPALKIPGMKYLFIDEIQNVDGFEEVVNEFRNEGGFSIFITGSNSYLLSGELATKLTGRYIELEIQTLSFKEYCDMKRFLGFPVDPNPIAELDSYILEGGFPKALDYPKMADKRTYVRSVIKEIFEKDIRRRVKVKDVSAFNLVRNYVINNFGATTSLTNILNDLEKKQHVRIRRETLNRYLQILEDAKIISKCTRFDMKSRKSLQGEQKYYLADLSFYFALNTDNRINYGPVLENIVYCYAKSRGYEVSVGRIGNLECDFILRDSEMNYAYVQVAMTIMNSPETEDREYRPLERIRDNWPKFVITRNDPIQHRNGIVHENVTEFIRANKGFDSMPAVK